MYIAWGREFTQFYNDGYRPILGSTKHPAAMGRRHARDVCRDLGHHRPDVRTASWRARATNVVDFMLPLDRHGFAEECYFIFSYSPIREESGRVGGVLVTVTETTARVRRRTSPEDHAGAGGRDAGGQDGREACARLPAACSPTNSADLPFALHLPARRGW